MLYEVITPPPAGRDRASGCSDRAVPSPRRRSPTAGRLRSGAGTPSAKNDPGHARIPEQRRDLLQSGRRITSYNVCYTKLLRIWAPTYRTTRPSCRPWRARCCCRGSMTFRRVITSYSIHYTKLYDFTCQEGARAEVERGFWPMTVSAAAGLIALTLGRLIGA